ncbi:hypothetical protein PL743_06690 [Phocaeicola vulgatus]|uniref:hypothetical protein n=1 Tax=Phocaeicola vulgatus TaxID=821 RepID=UPI00189AC691|nr:hypothetical protein [Phocaeicola vulgatus]MDB1083136.1 hypothetical protein [Phocaeicola vulgatus]MDB1091619.1 hypothetical protein [Phocaeicola vulgatus]
MRNLNCHIRHICHTAVYALELQRVAMVTDSVTDTVTDFCQSCTYATASFYMHDVGSFTQWNSLFHVVKLIVPNGAIHCIIAYNGLDYTCRECIPSISFRFTSLSEIPVPFASFFLKETFLYIALFPDFIRIFIDWKKRINTR